MSDGAFLGLSAGLGLLSIWWSLWEQDDERERRGVLGRGVDRRREDRVKVRLETVSPAAVPALSAGLGLVIAVALWALSDVVIPSLAFGLVSSSLPVLVLRSAARRRTTAMREVWPEAVDHINSAIRAGLSLPEALVQLSRKRPEEDRKSTRLNSSHDSISYAVLCLKKKHGSTDRGLLLRGLGNAGSNVFGRALECARLRAVLIRRGYRLQAGHSTIACRRIEQSGLD